VPAQGCCTLSRIMLRIGWLPAHPADGSESMLRYWRALRTACHTQRGVALEISEPIQPPNGPAVRREWIRRIFWKRVYYPLRVCSMPRADVYHLLDHSFAHVLPWLAKSVPVVATVHDLAPLWEGSELSVPQRRRFRKAMSQLRRATRLIADSKFTASEIVRELGISEDRISVVPLGAEIEHAGISPNTEPQNYLFSVGSVDERKNLQLLPSICEHAVRSIPGLRLVRAGDPLPLRLRQDILRVLDGRLEERGYVDERTLASLYRGALALVMPSRLEGFGLPVIEAMAYGCPVVCSQAASLPEAGGKAALYFEPDDGAKAAEHLIALTQSAQRAELVKAGLARAARFTWEAHADRVIAIYRDVAAGAAASSKRETEPSTK
jgi:glycosyltransferase involved in cell wall biosynthesis